MLLLFMLINFGDKAILGLAAKPIMRDLGLSASQYGLLSSGFFALFSISAIVVGFVANRVQTKWVLAVIAVVWAVTQLPMLTNVGFIAILASRVVLGAAEGPANPLALHAVQKWFPDERRGLPCSIVNLGASLGVVVLAPVMTSIIISFGWRWAFFTMFGIGLLWVAAWLVVGREGPYDSIEAATAAPVADGSTAAEPHIAYRHIFLCGTSLSLLVAGFAAYWALALLISWVPAYLEGPLGFGARAAGLLVVLPWGVSGVLMLCQGFLTDGLMRRGVSSRIARGLLGAGCVLVAGVAMLLLPVAPAGLATMVLLTLAFAIGGVQFAIGATVIGAIVPVRQRAAVFSTLTGLITTAGLVAPYVTGRLVEAAGGADSAAGFNHAFVIAGVLLLAGGTMSVLFTRPERDATRLGESAEVATGPGDHENLSDACKRDFPS
ncbi:MFS transporter [Rhodococcus sp. NPDC127528]|uniref:MFS transporter n=1 Tax=unclassified Rhodococcus (in: high G+C Gram-positive bacteria) TaxID=192944 RepID=UPI00363F167F